MYRYVALARNVLCRPDWPGTPSRSFSFCFLGAGIEGNPSYSASFINFLMTRRSYIINQGNTVTISQNARVLHFFFLSKCCYTTHLSVIIFFPLVASKIVCNSWVPINALSLLDLTSLMENPGILGGLQCLSHSHTVEVSL